jgi:hypothetical protein
MDPTKLRMIGVSMKLKLIAEFVDVIKVRHDTLQDALLVMAIEADNIQHATGQVYAYNEILKLLENLEV